MLFEVIKIDEEFVVVVVLFFIFLDFIWFLKVVLELLYEDIIDDELYVLGIMLICIFLELFWFVLVVIEFLFEDIKFVDLVMWLFVGGVLLWVLNGLIFEVFVIVFVIFFWGLFGVFFFVDMVFV